MSSQLFHVYKDGAVFCSRDSGSFIDQTSEEMMQNLKIADSILSIQSGNAIIPLKSTDKPLKLYPSLMTTPDPKSNKEIQTLIIEPLDFQGKISFNFECKHQDADKIPNFLVKFDYNQLSKINFNDFLQTVSEQFDLPHKDGHLLMDDQKIDSTMEINKIIEYCYHKPLVYSCTLEEKGQYIIRMRKKLVSEIISSEMVYINDINTLMNFFRPQLTNSGLLGKDQLEMMFNDIPTMISCHVHFLASLQKKGTDFDAIVSDCLIEFSRFFKLSANYVGHYQEINKAATKLPKMFQEDLIKKCPLNESGRDLTSYLITPIQRYPRYILFIRELIKFTPKCHPDAAGLQIAQLKIDLITKEIEEQRDKNLHNKSIIAIQEKVDSSIKILAPARDLIRKYKITIPEFPKQKAKIYHFTDVELICVAKSAKSYQVLIFEKNLSLRYDSNYTADSILFFKKTSRTIQAVFASIEDKIDFLQNIALQRSIFFDKLPNKSNSILWSDVSLAQESPHVINPQSAIINENIYFMGGFIQSNNIKDKMPMVIYNVNTNTFSTNTVLSLPFGYSSFISDENMKLILFGGTEKDSIRPSNSVFTLQLGNMSWERIENSSISPRTHHSAIFYKDSMIIFGGMNEKGEAINECLIFKDNQLNYLNTKGEPPKQRYLHSVSLLGKYMIVHGGTNGKISFSDIWALDLDDYSWNQLKINQQLQRRNGHKTFVSGKYLFSVGGCNNTEMTFETNAVDLTTGDVFKFENEGNFQRIAHFALAVFNTNVYIFGGRDNESKNIRSSLSIFTIPESFYQNSPEQNYDIKKIFIIKDSPILVDLKKNDIFIKGSQSTIITPQTRAQILISAKSHVKEAPVSNEDKDSIIKRLCKELQIDYSGLQTFRQNMIIKNLLHLHDLRVENQQLKNKIEIKKKEKELAEKAFAKIGTKIAIFDTKTKVSKIVNMTVDLHYKDLIELIDMIIGRQSVSVQIRLKGKLVSLNNDTFYSAILQSNIMKIVVN